ncbi:MAG: glutamine amidotransferase-related protein [Alphaproteobacteria bacterium]
MTFIKSKIFDILFFLWTAFICITFIVFIIFSQDAALFAARLWAKGVLILLKFICEIEVKIEGLENLPKDCLLLARTKKCKVAAFRYKNAPIYGVQFHPEMTVEDIKERLKKYPQYKTKKMKFLPSPFSFKILMNFSKLCE